MNGVVVDASTALAWCFPDETSEYADGVLIALEGHTILVPAIWSLELANAVLVGERKKRLNQSEIKIFTTLLESLSIVEDTRSVGENISNVLPHARTYDAAYLELSIRQAAPLATLDARLQKAANLAGVTLFKGEAHK